MLKKRGKYWYYRLEDESIFHSTGKTARGAAESFVVELIKHKRKDTTSHAEGLTLREYAERCFVWEAFPHVGPPGEREEKYHQTTCEGTARVIGKKCLL